MRKYIWNLLVSLDQHVNVILGGKPDETISSRAGKAVEEGKTWAVILCRVLHVFDKNHCAKSIERDE